MKSNIVFLLIILFCWNMNYAQDEEGTLDINFGNNGWVFTDFESNMDFGRAIAIQDDNKIIIAGSSDNEHGANSDFALARYNSDGTLDNGFGINGKIITPIGSTFDSPFAIALQNDGKIVVAGYCAKYVPGSSLVDPMVDSVTTNDFAIVRYLENGEYDNDFGENGIVINDFGENGIFRSIVIQSDGKILAAGDCYFESKSTYVVFRFNTDGNLDNTFGETGISHYGIDTYFNTCRSMILQSDGKILLAGETGNSLDKNFGVIRLNPNGTLDNSFNNTGKVSFSFGNSSSCRSINLQSDSKIIISGSTFTSTGNFDFALARLNIDGTNDVTFGDNGIVKTNIEKNDDCWSATVLPDNSIVLSGYTTDNSSSKIAMVRYNSNGSIDTSFGNDGVVTTSINTDSWLYSEDIKVQNDGKLLLAGYSRVNNNYDFLLLRYNSELKPVNITQLDIIKNFKIYPNPIKDNCKLQFSIERKEHLSIYLYDLNGKQLKTFVNYREFYTGNVELDLDFSDIPSGYYELVIKSNNESKSINIIK